MTPDPTEGGGGLLRRVARLFKPYRLQVAVVLVLILVTSGLGVVNPLLTKAVFDDALFPRGGGPNLTLLYILVGIMIASRSSAARSASARRTSPASSASG